MKKVLKKLISTTLSFAIIFASVYIVAESSSENVIKTGDVFELGEYPQELVTDETLIKMLNSCVGEFTSYDYYDLSGSRTSFMSYKDISLSGDQYRAVYFTEYRPYSSQKANGFVESSVYWFKYKPVKWRLLNGLTGLSICEMVIDSQSYHHTGDTINGVYPNNYVNSDIRKWLINTFYDTVFDDDERNLIFSKSIDNSSPHSKYSSSSTSDKIFLLSKDEYNNISASYKEALCTDYSKAQGCHTVYGEYSKTVGLRTAGGLPYGIYYYTYGSGSCNGYNNKNDAIFVLSGIRPAFYLNVDAYKVEQGKITGTFQNYGLVILMDENANNSTSYISPITVDAQEYKVREGVITTPSQAETYIGKTVNAYRDDEGYIYKIEPVEEKKTNEANWYQPITNPNINYGVTETKATRASKVLEATNDFINAMQKYLDMLGDEVDEDEKFISVNDIVNDLKNNEEACFTLTNATASAVESAYYAIANFIKDVANNNKLYLNLNSGDSEYKQATTMLKTLISSGQKITRSYAHGNYKVTLKNVYLLEQAFSGTIIVEKYKGSDKGTQYIGGFSSDPQRTMDVMLAYTNNLGEIVDDQCKYALAQIQSDFMSVTGLADADEMFLKNYFTNKTTALLEGKYGDVLQMFLNIKRGYDAIRNFDKFCGNIGGNAETWLSFEGGENALSLKTTLDDLDVDYSLEGNVKWCVKSAIKSVEKTQEKLSNELYNYLYDVDTGDPDNKSDWEKFWSGNWFCSTIQCPVEFEVYDSQGNLIGYVDSSENHNEYIDFNDEIYIDMVNDVKYIYYPSNMEISIKFTAIDDGQMNYAIEQFENGVPKGRVNYFDVPLTLNEQFEQTVPANTDLIQTAEILSFEHSDTSVVGEYISVEEEAYITVDCTSDNQGFAIGGGQYPIGSSVKMMAFEDEGCEFQGWYLGDSLVSTDIVYQFTAIEDTEIYALFESVTDFVLKDDADAKIDSENKILVGNDILSYSADTIDSLFKYGNILIKGKEKGKIGTGDMICAASDRGVICNTLTVIIFGDVNGDGWYDGQDAIIVDCLANGMLTKDDVGEAVYMAADCNHDGVIDQLDVALLNQAGTLLANVDQSKPAEVLLETSAEYVEYLDLIDQSPELDIEDETDASEVDVEDTPEADTEDAKVDIFEMIMNFIKSIFEMLLSYIPMPLK